MQRPSVLERALVFEQRRVLRTLGAFSVGPYSRRYRASCRRLRHSCSTREVRERLLRADFVFVGDYRTFPRARSQFLELIESACRKARPVLIALADLPVRAQGAVDRYLRGAQTEQGLRTAAFDESLEGELRWTAVLPVLRYALERRLRVLAIGEPCPEGTSPLARDRACAHLLADRVSSQQMSTGAAQVWVLAGEMRVAPEHLPRALARELRPKSALRFVTLFQTGDGLSARAGGVPRARGSLGYLTSSESVFLPCGRASEILQSHLDALELEPGDALLVETPAQSLNRLAEHIAHTFDVSTLR